MAAGGEMRAIRGKEGDWSGRERVRARAALKVVGGGSGPSGAAGGGRLSSWQVGWATHAGRNNQQDRTGQSGREQQSVTIRDKRRGRE